MEVPAGFLQPLWNLRSSEEMEIINLSTTSLCKLGYNKEIAFFRGYKMWYTHYFVLIVTEQTVVVVGHDILITWLLDSFIRLFFELGWFLNKIGIFIKGQHKLSPFWIVNLFKSSNFSDYVAFHSISDFYNWNFITIDKLLLIIMVGFFLICFRWKYPLWSIRPITFVTYGNLDKNLPAFL